MLVRLQRLVSLIDSYKVATILLFITEFNLVYTNYPVINNLTNLFLNFDHLVTSNIFLYV